MTTKRNTPPADFRTRLIAFLLVLAVGFVMGIVNGRSGPTDDLTTTGIVSGQAADQADGASDASDANRQEQQERQERQAAPLDADEGAQDAQTLGSDQQSDDAGTKTVAPERGPTVSENGRYTSKDEVALYIHTYGHLPANFISKTKARQQGWESSEGNLDEVCPGMSIGGSTFYNSEGKLPDKRGRRWTECDINYHGGYRGAERIVFSNDGLIYYTGDHYQTYERLY